MKIGIDAKRIFLNKTGLGSYGRNLIQGLNELDLGDEIILYTTKSSELFSLRGFKKNFRKFVTKSKLRSFWRSYSISSQLKKDKVELYHGISNELPFSLGKKKSINTIVDIHDLLFLRFPEFYQLTDRKTFEFKTKFACENADRVIVTSEATKQDVIKYYHLDESKIRVIYQGCHSSFYKPLTEKEKQKVLEKYKLPKEYILCVGTIQERKNQKQILEALKISKHKLPLVLIGGGNKYKDEIILFAQENQLELVIPSQFVLDKDLPAIYQSSSLFVFPGLYEGFGIPVLEAMASKTQVITSINTSMSEIVQEKECLVNPLSTEELAEKIDLFLEDKDETLIAKNYERALEFTNKKFAERVLKIYDEFRD